MDGYAFARRSRGFSRLSVILLSLVSLATTACKPGDDRGQYLQDKPTVLKPVGARCTGDSSKTCLALHYVVYSDASGKAVIDASGAQANVEQVNAIYSGCGIAFQIDNFEVVDPRAKDLDFSTSTFEDMDKARVAYGEQSTFLAVTTGAWSGALKAAGANAWTQPPQADVWGTVMEAPVADYANILGHELGHYLNLDHVSDQSDLMNPVVYNSSRKLSADQCSTMRSAVTEFWTAMVRN